MAFGKKAAAAVIAVAPEVGPLGPLVDGVVKNVLTRALGPGDRVPLEIFFNYALFSLCICLCIFTASRIISPRLFKGAMSHLKPFEVKIWHTNMVTFLPTFAVTFFALSANSISFIPAAPNFPSSVAFFSSICRCKNLAFSSAFFRRSTSARRSGAD